MSASHTEIFNIMAAIAAAQSSNGAMALATVVDVEGAADCGTGARVLIFDTGDWVGSTTSVGLEGNALHIAREVMRTGVPQHITLDTRTDADTRVLGAALGCNGVIQVWIESVAGEFAMAGLEALQRALLGESERWFARMLVGIQEEIGRIFPLGSLGKDRAVWQGDVAANFVAEEGLQKVVFASKPCLFAVECIVPATRQHDRNDTI